MFSTIIVFSGNYGAGKTTAANAMVGKANSFALADPIRKQVFYLLKDSLIHSKDQNDKNKKVGKGKILKCIKEKPASNKISAPVFRNFKEACLKEKDLTQVTYRRMLQLYGGAGRKVNRYYWTRECLKLMVEVHSSSSVAIDDVRFVAELEEIRSFASKRKIRVVHIWLGEPADDNYENKQLEGLADYKMSF